MFVRLLVRMCLWTLKRLLHGLPAELWLLYFDLSAFQRCTRPTWHVWVIWILLKCRTITELLQRFGYKKDAKFAHKYGGYFRNDADHRDFVGIGTAAGQSCLLELLLLGVVAFCCGSVHFRLAALPADHVL